MNAVDPSGHIKRGTGIWVNVKAILAIAGGLVGLQPTQNPGHGLVGSVPTIGLSNPGEKTGKMKEMEKRVFRRELRQH